MATPTPSPSVGLNPIGGGGEHTGAAGDNPYAPELYSELESEASYDTEYSFAQQSSFSNLDVTAPEEFQTEVENALRRENVAPSPDLVAQIAKSLWSDANLRSNYLTAQQAYASGADPAGFTLGQVRSEIYSQMFDPSSARNQEVLNQSLQIVSSGGGKLTSDQQKYLLDSYGGNADLNQIIIDTAEKYGIPPALALAVAYHESGMRVDAVGDQGHSVGLFQLNDQGEGAGMTVEQREDPRVNADIALREFAAALKADPSLANNWGAWAVAAQRPDNTGNQYANAINGLVGEIQDGWVPKPGTPGQLDPYTEKQYGPLISLFQKYYGRKPNGNELAGFEGMTPDQMDTVLRAQPSHLPGMSMGQYQDVKQKADTQMFAIFGHEASDSIVQTLNDSGMTNDAGMKYFLTELGMTPGKDIDPKVYNSLYQAANPSSMAYYNQPPDPRTLQQVWHQNGSPGSQPSSQSKQEAYLTSLPGQGTLASQRVFGEEPVSQ